VIYRVFQENSKVRLAEFQVNWPLLQREERIPIEVNGKEGLYLITEVGGPQMDRNRLVMDVWVRDVTPK
jgi:hypothetical protein